MKVLAAGASVLFLLGADVMAAAGVRQDVNLSGEWVYQKVSDLAVAPGGEWRPFTVPGYLSGTNYERAWFKRTFDADAGWKGQRIKLHFGGVKYNSVVMVNGQKVGGNLGGYEPFEMDITQAVKLSAANELLVGVHDWTGVFADFVRSEKTDLSGIKEWHELRSKPKNALLSPIGGLFSLYGIWEPVTLQVRPPVHVGSAFVKTSVRKKRIEADVTVVNDEARRTSDATAPREVVVKAQVFDPKENKAVLDLPESRLTVKAGESQTVTLGQDWPDPKLWSHLSPHLYELRVEAVAHDAARRTSDATSFRFGFREFWCDKDEFYLNGVKINLLAASTWPQHKIVERDHIEETYRAVKEAHCVAIRLHTQPWQRIYYDVADELGLLVVVEGAVWCDQNYRFTDPQWWENYATHLRRTVANLQNHPSVIIWSLENEILHCAPGGKESPATDGLAEMGRLVKRLDPTRPIMYEADLDPRGVADVVGVHYPEPEYPRVTQYPNVCYWMDDEIKMKRPLVDDPRERWKWDRKKPVYIGEFLGVPARDPSPSTVFFGDEAYDSFAKYHTLAKAASWRMQNEAYRWYGVNGICPWTMFEGPGGVLAREKNPLWAAVRDSFHPNAVFVKEYDTRFYAGDEVARTLTAYNDTFSDGAFTLTWSLTCQGKTVAEGKAPLKLGSAERKTTTVKFTMPAADQPTEAAFKAALLREGGEVCFEQTRTYQVFPKVRLSIPTGCRLALYDVDGMTEKLLSAEGISFEKAASLAEIPRDANVLIIGEQTLKATAAPEGGIVVGRPNPDRDRLMAFVRGGGRALVLAQTTYPSELLPTQLSDHASTMTFAQMPNHPILKDISADDLKFWRGDHMVSQHEALRPSSGGCRPVIVSGSAAGLSHCALLELPRGEGTFVLCQLRLAEKLDTEPVAKRILQNILHHLAAFTPDTRPTWVASDSEDFLRLLAAMRLRFTNVTGKLGQTELPATGLLILSGNMEDIAAHQKKVAAFLEAGGRALFHGLTPQQMKDLSELFPQDVSLHAHRGRVAAINWADPMTAGWTRESLYWLGKHEGPGHARTPLAEGVAEYALVSGKSGPPVARLQATDMSLEGHLVHKQEDHVAMSTVGSVSKEIEIAEDGRYGIVVTARGTPMDNGWPMMEIAVDAETVNLVSVPSRDWITVSAPCDLRKGGRTLKVSFINDASRPGEDRNMYVKQVDIVRMPPGAEGYVPLTKPAFAARFDRGKGCAVLDEITWSTESRNAQKALQYGQGLLTALGAEFEDAWGDAIGPAALVEDKKMAHFTRAAHQVTLASAGYVTAKATFATGGRYTFELLARGTPLDNIYPIVEVQIDGAPVGAIELKSDGWRPYTLEVDAPAGDREIKLVFTNDQWRPPEDRNLYIQKLLIYKR